MKVAKTRVKFLILWLPVLIYAIIIFYLSSLPSTPTPFEFPFFDKFLHIIEFTIFAVLLMRAMKNSFTNLSKVRLFFWVVFFGIIYGISDEMHQIFVPTRDPSILDVFADAIGSAIGAFIFKR